MTAIYNQALPTARDRIRLALSDTTVEPESSAFLPDETYDALITMHGETMATVVAAESLANKFGQNPTQVVLAGGKAFTWGDRIKPLLELAARLRTALNATTAGAVSNATRVASPTRGEQDVSEYRRSEYEPWPAP
ncbi:MAG TPA: hypothetical protein VF914_14305 [Chloroflexia bacterium]|jgi:hypothetical protein